MTAIATAVSERYEMVVGLEVHVQLATKTKAFCNCSTRPGAAPNLNTCAVCLALPGTLPVLNAEAVTIGVRAALAFGATVHPTSVFARKNYFYPDLPKGYQISQYDRPLATGGRLPIATNPDGSDLCIGITRIHLEEDAGKSIHDRYPAESAIDLNRAGVPLIEIVSEPEMRSSRDAHAYLIALKEILEYAGVSDCNMELGSLRVDANVSARIRGETRLGTKTEVKNMNSFSGVVRALESEFARQCALLDRGGTVEQQTMLWDGGRGEVRPSRTKEGSHDYRYFPEPDLPPLIISGKAIDEIRRGMPELPRARRERFAREYGLAPADIEALTVSPHVADYYETVARSHKEPKTAANWIRNTVMQHLNVACVEIRDFRVRPADLARLLDMVRDGLVSHTAAQAIFARMAESGDRPEQIAERDGLLQQRDAGALTSWISEVLAENPAEAARFLAGERKLLGVLVGKVMKKSKGSADPKRVNQLLLERAGG